MKKIIIICPTERDRRELGVICGEKGYGHDYVFYGENPREYLPEFDPLVFIEDFDKDFKNTAIDGIIGTHDYPGSILASILCSKYGLAGVGILPNLLCQHKYYSRMAQKRAVPDAVPGFHLIDPSYISSRPRAFPVFVKPVKAFFSIFARQVEDRVQYEELLTYFNKEGKELSGPLNRLMEKYSSLRPGGGQLLAEQVLEGSQVTVEGYVYQGRTSFLGITDSIMYPGTISFKRFDYPSTVPEKARARMYRISRSFIEAIGFDNGMFNIEFFYDTKKDLVKIIEANPRMASQFADLFEKVDGTNSYKIQVDLALGRKPAVKTRCGKHRVASSFVLRSFEDKRVKRSPGKKEVEKVHKLFPDARLEIYAKKGALLSEQLQDIHSYRYGIINLGADSMADLGYKYKQCIQLLDFKFM